MSRFLFSVLLVGPGLLAGALLVGFPSSEASQTYAEHAPLGHTGGFGEPTCHACHLGSEVNEEGGRLTVTGVSKSVRPDSTYRLTVALADSTS